MQRFIKHQVLEMDEHKIQRCVICGEIICDYSAGAFSSRPAALSGFSPGEVFVTGVNPVEIQSYLTSDQYSIDCSSITTASDKYSEKTEFFQFLEDEDQKYVVLAHAYQLKALKKIEKLRRIFNLGNPKVFMGTKDGSKYCRVHADSADVMKVLTKEYL